MSCLGVHFALTEDHVKQLRRLKDDDKRLAFLQEELEEELLGGDSEWAFETDKAWDALHRAFTDGELGYDNGEFPLSHVILGGECLYFEDDYLMSLKTPEQVKEIAPKLGNVGPEHIRSGYRQIDPNAYGMELTDEDLEYTLGNFEGLAAFYARAAVANRYVLFTADQ